jgi:hypothetical protein
MKVSRFNFKDEYEQGKPPAAVWVTRSLIVGVILGGVCFIMILYPNAFNLF